MLSLDDQIDILRQIRSLSGQLLDTDDAFMIGPYEQLQGRVDATLQILCVDGWDHEVPVALAKMAHSGAGS